LNELLNKTVPIWLWLLWMVPGAVPAQINPDDLLPVDEAFALSARVAPAGDRVELEWKIADGYYMYRHAFGFEATTENAKLGAPAIPPGEAYTDEFFGAVETYRDRVRITVPIARRPAGQTLAVRVSHQGCADLGVCYPPQRDRVELALPVAAATPPVATRTRPALGVQPGVGHPLPAEQAFHAEALAMDGATVVVRLTAQPGYYLYRDSIEFVAEDPEIRIANVDLPPAEPLTDEYFGDTHGYFGQIDIPLALTRPAGPAGTLELAIRFQGCQADGICYPPMARALDVALPALDETVAPSPSTADDTAAGASEAPVMESEQDRLARLITEQPLIVTLALFVLLGAGLAFTPCVFPMIPILSGIIAGEGENVTRGKAFALSLAYVLAMALTYTTVGVVAALAGYNLQIFFQNPWVLSIFAAIFVTLSLAMFGFYNLQMPAAVQAKLTEISNRQSGGSLIGAAIMGFLSALIVGPCVTAPLIGILIFISQTGDAVLGGSVLFALSIGMGLPLLAIGVGLGSWLPKAGAWMDAVKAAFGVGLLALAIWMLERIVPGAVTMLLWGLLLTASGVYLGALTRLDAAVSGWSKLWQALGVVLLVFGILQFVGAAAGGNDWLRPLAPFAGARGGAQAEQQAQFVEVTDLAQIERAVAGADRPVMLDFYADWCVSCKEMERYTFPDPQVNQVMRRFALLKIDMTNFNDAHQEVLSHFGLMGPPAYLFFGNREELPSFRLFGFVKADAFIDHLARVEQAAR